MIAKLKISERAILATLDAALMNPISRQAAREAVEVVETTALRHVDLITRWPLASGINHDIKKLHRETFDNMARQSVRSSGVISAKE